MTTTQPIPKSTAEGAGHEKDRALSKQINVALFCGGRGSASMIRELMRWPQINLSLIVNGYDDGLSTGHLRDLMPNMLGPSDFRKNLSRLIDLHSSEQYGLQKLLEYRFAKDFSQADIQIFQKFLSNPRLESSLPKPLDALMHELHPEIKRVVIGHLKTLFEFQNVHQQVLNYTDCSFGNLVFAGAYLEADFNFNASVQSLAELCRTSVKIVNVTQGENRILVALKEDGQMLFRESEIVAAQSASPIREILLLESPLSEATREKLEGMDVEAKLAFLRELDAPVRISPESNYALRNADVIIYGPGTQFSSLLPSYLTLGLPLAVEESKAAVKIFVCNVGEDFDIQGLSCSDLVDKALAMMGNESNSKSLITHVFCNQSDQDSRTTPLPVGEASAAVYKNASVTRAAFESAATTGTHSGYAVVRRAIDLFEASSKRSKLRSLEIYVDLRDRSRAVDQLVEEFLDLPWTDEQFEAVQLRLNQPYETELKLPSYATLACDNYQGLFTEVDALSRWLTESETDYLVTLTGDGEYRLKDILNGVQILRLSPFGAVYGSRTQSRYQFRTALDSAYGENSNLRFISFCGAFLFTAVFALLFRVIFSDPFTGFRIYRRSKIDNKFAQDLQKLGSVPAARVTRLMLHHRIEIAEIPVVYRTFRGFTKPGWRLQRGLKNLAGLLR